MSEIQFTDQYQALGIPYPDLATMCQGDCEGTGWIPVSRTDATPTLRALWGEQHRFTCGALGRIRNVLHGLVTFDRYRIRMGIGRCDGYHFVKCPDCAGSGKRRIA